MADKRDINFVPTRKGGEIPKWGEALLKWHNRLADNRGDRAELKKCKSHVQVVFVPVYHKLYQEIAAIGKAAAESKAIAWSWEKLEERVQQRLPIIAALTALVSPSEQPGSTGESEKWMKSLPRQMGTIRSSGGGPVVSDLRFRRLLKCRTAEELYPALRRIIGLLNTQAIILSLAQSVFYWNEDMRKEWAYDYYATETHTEEDTTREGSAS